jgi:putative FmdB family regulatory protein
MPIYDFQCNRCGHQQELLRKISDPATAQCPACKHETFSKQLSAPAFQLNGTGWYATDFKGDKKPNNGDKKISSDSPVQSAEAAPASCSPGCACH